MSHHPQDEAAEKLIKLVVREQVNCFNCEHIDVVGNICRKYGSQPPLKIVRTGCPAFSRSIPF
jgi:hypothetical protein